MENAPSMPWLPIRPKSLLHHLLIHPQLFHHRRRPHHPRHRLPLPPHHLPLLALPLVSAVTFPIARAMRLAVAYMSSMIFAWSTAAVNTRTPFAALEQSTAAPVTTPFAMWKKAYVSRYIWLSHQCFCFCSWERYNSPYLFVCFLYYRTRETT